jgi:hypothetical protein
MDFDAVVEPIEANGSICVLIGTVQNRVADDLLESDDRIIRRPDFNGTGGEVRRRLDVILDEVLEFVEEVGQRASNLLLVPNRVAQGHPVNTEELHVGAGNPVRRRLADGKNS